MDYNEQLQKINTAEESGDLWAIEDVKKVMESDRKNGENMGNAMVLMAAEKAIEKFATKKAEVTEIPNWRIDQINRTGGTPEEIDQITADINKQTEKSVIQGWYNIIQQIPESMRTAEQQRSFVEYEKELAAIAKSTDQTIRGVAADRIENARVAENLEKLDLTKISPVDAAMNETLGNFSESMSSQIASGASLWDMPSDTEDDEPVSFTDRIQPTAEKVDEAHKEYLKNEIDSISAAVSAGFGNDQALNRGIDLEKRLDEYNQPKKTSPQDIFQTLENAADTLEQGHKAPETSPEGFGGVIARLHRDDLGSVYGTLKEHGDIDGKTPDQIWAAIKLYMRGASDESHIPESFGLQAKMVEIKKVRDAELESFGVSIDKESGAATVQESTVDNNSATVAVPEVIPVAVSPEIVPEPQSVTPEIATGETDVEKSPMVLQKIKDAKTPEDLENALRSVRVLHVGNESVETYIPVYMIERYMRADFDPNEITNIGGIRDKAIELRMGVRPEPIVEEIKPEPVITASPVNSLGTINLSPESAQEEKEIEADILEDDDSLESYDMSEEEDDDIENNDELLPDFNFFSTPSSELIQKLEKIESLDEKLNILERLNLIQPIEINGKEYNAIDYLDRVMVLSKIGNLRIPFYISTGSAGKKNVEAGKWYAVFGIGDDGWINKGTEELINSQYNNPALQKMAKILNEGIGKINLRENNGMGKIKEGYYFLPDDEIDLFNKNLGWESKPVSNDGSGAFWDHVKNVLGELNNEMVKMQKNNGIVPQDSKGVEPDPEVENIPITKIESTGHISYQEYGKKFQYFDEGDKTSFTPYEGENVFSYNEQTNEVLPLKEGWRSALVNPSYFLNKAFNGDWGKIGNTPIEDLKFIPAKLDRNGKIIQKGQVILREELNKAA